MPEIVDPSPIIEEQRVLATEHEPRIAELDQAIVGTDRKAALPLRDERRRSKRSYREARRAVEKLRGHCAAW